MKPINAKHLITALLYFIAFVGLAFAMPACSTFEGAFRRYGTTHVDTTYQTVSLTVPRDSAVLRVRTDTTRLIERTRQGRATVTIIREPTFTTVVAECDSASIAKTIPVKTVKQIWGVDPAFERKFRTWRTVSFVLIGLLIVGIIAYLLIHKFMLSVNLSKR